MDVLTVVLSCVLAVPIQLLVMYGVYSRWILPAIQKYVAEVPGTVRANIEPYIDEKITGLVSDIDSKVSDVSNSVKMSSLRAQRTIKQAADSLGIEDLESLDTPEGQQRVQDKLTTAYGYHIAIEAFQNVLASWRAKQTEDPPSARSPEANNLW